MFDFIPASDYTAIYYHLLLIVSFYMLIQSRVYFIEQRETIRTSQNIGYVLLIFTILYMGTRPVSWAFGDMTTYAEGFTKMQLDPNLPIKREIFFGYFTKLCAELMDVRTYFLLIDVIYILPFIFLPKNIFLIIGSYPF